MRTEKLQCPKDKMKILQISRKKKISTTNKIGINLRVDFSSEGPGESELYLESAKERISPLQSHWNFMLIKSRFSVTKR